MVSGCSRLVSGEIIAILIISCEMNFLGNENNCNNMVHIHVSSCLWLILLIVI